MTESALAWAAGLFEGEGTFAINRDGGGGCVLKAALSMTDEDVVRTFARTVAVGTVCRKGQQNPKWRCLWAWQASGEDAERALSLLMPWLHERRRARWAELVAERRSYEQRLPLIRSERAVAASRTRRLRALRTQVEKLW